MILCRQWMVFMSLVIDLIGQLNCHVIGCHSPPATSTTSSGLTLLLTVWPGATQSTKLLPSSKLTEETHLKTRDRGGRLAPPPPLHQTLHFPADTAHGPASPASVWSATSVPAVDKNVDKLHKSSFAKPSHDDDDIGCKTR